MTDNVYYLTFDEELSGWETWNYPPRPDADRKAMHDYDLTSMKVEATYPPWIGTGIKYIDFRGYDRLSMAARGYMPPDGGAVGFLMVALQEAPSFYTSASFETRELSWDLSDHQGVYYVGVQAISWTSPCWVELIPTKALTMKSLQQIRRAAFRIGTVGT